MNVMAYPVLVEEVGSGGDERVFVVNFPDLPDAITSCIDETEFRIYAVDCLDVALGWRIKEGRDIPAASESAGRRTVSPSVTIAAKVLLYVELRRQNVTNAELARRIGVFPQEVGRMLDPATKTKIVVLEKALAALGKRLVVGVE